MQLRSQDGMFGDHMDCMTVAPELRGSIDLPAGDIQRPAVSDFAAIRECSNIESIYP